MIRSLTVKSLCLSKSINVRPLLSCPRVTGILPNPKILLPQSDVGVLSNVKQRTISTTARNTALADQGAISRPIMAVNIADKCEKFIAENKVVIFSKTTCPFCSKVKGVFAQLNEPAFVYELNENEDGTEVQNHLLARTNQRTVPNVFIQGQHVGGCDSVIKALADGNLHRLLSTQRGDDPGSNEIPTGESYDYDIFVIGGGSGGLAAAKEAASLGKKVGMADFVVPSPIGTTWGLGGTCVNVGCIPKKLMHQGSILGESLHDAESFGWQVKRDQVGHNWEVLLENVQNYIKSLNFGYRKEMIKKSVTYLNAYAEFVTPNRLKLTKKNGETQEVTAGSVIISVGGRPIYPDIPGAREYGITSDDLFSLQRPPGRTLIVGASYIALECGGFLRGLGFDVTIMVRSILLRGFDQQMAELIGEDMQRMGVNFLRGYVPTSVEKSPDGKLTVTAKTGDTQEVLEGFDTVMFAIGREACTTRLGLQNVPIKLNPKNKKVIVDNAERSSVPNIFAIGDVIDGKPELTPVAIQAGRLLAQRLVGAHNRVTNYRHIPTTVFTPLEYGCVGLSEEDAIAMFGADNITVYHNAFKPLEHALSREVTVGYAKLICVRSMEELVVGFHVLSPNAGEMTQGFAIGLKLGAKKSDFDDLIGIHPTTAEVFTTLTTVKNPGDRPPETTGC